MGKVSLDISTLPQLDDVIAYSGMNQQASKVVGSGLKVLLEVACNKRYDNPLLVIRRDELIMTCIHSLLAVRRSAT